MFRLFEKGREKIGGFIGGAGLENWWLGEFDDEERRQINRTYRPMGSSPDVESILTTGPIQKAGFEAVSTLSNVATWFKRSEDRTIAYRFLQKAEELLPQSKDILTAHFFYQAKCQVNYRWREIDDLAGDLCILGQGLGGQSILTQDGEILFHVPVARQECEVGLRSARHVL